MDEAKLIFLFDRGHDVDEEMLVDDDRRAAAIALSFGHDDGDLPALQLLAYGVISHQVLHDDPPATWAAVQRMQGAGLERESIFRQLSMVIMEGLIAALDEHEPVDLAATADRMDSLPLPDAVALEEAIVEIVRAEPGVSLDEAERRAVETIVGAGKSDDPLVERLVGRVSDHLIDGPWAPLALIAGDRAADVDSLLADRWLTHRFNEVEVEANWVNATFDLWVHRRRDDLHLPDGRDVANIAGEPEQLGWHGPDGWLDGIEAGSVVAYRVRTDGTLDVDVLADDPVVPDGLIDALRAYYEQQLEEPGLPVDAEDLVVGLLLARPDAFDAPTLPLRELAEAAGLEVRRTMAAHHLWVWRRLAHLRRMGRVMSQAEPGDERTRQAIAVLGLADHLSAELHGQLEPDEPAPTIDAHEAIAVLHDEPVVLMLVADELLGAPPDHLPALDPSPFLAAIEDAADDDHLRGVAGLLSAIHLERQGDLAGAETTLTRAHALDPTQPALIDRLAWYASDRGDARRAAQLWQTIEAPSVELDLAAVEKASGLARSLGRNERCWCGSGRKYKQCHLGRAELAPLPDRVGWLCRKAAGFVERRAGEARADVFELASERSLDGELFPVHEALTDPLVMDLALCEGGWFDRFLEERGPLLPDDEVLLGSSWLLVRRTVYEIESVSPGESVDVRDLRTGDRLSVQERTFSASARVGMLVCARAVPDGPGHQFVGGVFTVPPGRESALLDVLDEAHDAGDGRAVAAWVAALEAPPTLLDPDGNVIDLDALRAAAELEDGEDAWDPVDLDDDPEVRAILDHHRDEMERSWCDESVPALAGLTPREAAADPTRRPELIRLIASFEPLAEAAGPTALTFRPDRLRELLGLDDG